MKQLTGLFLSSLLIASCLATTAMDLQRIESSEFGKQLVKTIEIQLTSEGPVEDILSMLSELDDEIINDQEATDALHKDFQARCETDLQSIQNEFEIATEDSQAASEALKLDVPKFEQLTKDKTRLADETKSTQQSLEDLQNQRDKEAGEYDDRVQEIENALDAFNEARRIVSRLYDMIADDAGSSSSSSDDSSDDVDLREDDEDAGEGNFLQLQSHGKNTASTSSKSENTLKEFRQYLQRTELKQKGYASIAASMAELAESKELASNKKLVGKLLCLFDQVMGNLNEAAVDEKHAEDARIEVYKDNYNNVNSNLQSLQAQTNNVEYQLSTLDEKIEYSKGKLEDANRRVDEKKDQKCDKQSVCTDEQHTYEDQTTRNQDQRDTIAELAEIINSKLGQFKQYIKDRANSQCGHHQEIRLTVNSHIVCD
eukprot:TRINITY_DN5149_c0_g1_i2.p1 TRINITY_DN5149_c0_g1~~TRINITY_DN5149_c0_g1_i2.p1  ORF type:complete len:428 (-),score=162.85 TRINITY_DN5149_c0_g1_i2:310-1593(-)